VDIKDNGKYEGRTFLNGDLSLSFRMYVVLLVVSIILPAGFAEPSTCPENPINSGDLAEYEYEIFRYAPNKTSCITFRKKMNQDSNGETKGTNECYATIDCRRFRTAQACYDIFYLDLASDSEAKIALDNNNDKEMAKDCAKLKL
jgi:hypothetical protein